MDFQKRIQELLDERGWTKYKLARECNLSDSTIANIFLRNTEPSPSTVELICDGFGISVAQFYAKGNMVEMTPDLKELFDKWKYLTPEQKQAVLNLIKVMN